MTWCLGRLRRWRWGSRLFNRDVSVIGGLWKKRMAAGIEELRGAVGRVKKGKAGRKTCKKAYHCYHWQQLMKACCWWKSSNLRCTDVPIFFVPRWWSWQHSDGQVFCIIFFLLIWSFWIFKFCDHQVPVVDLETPSEESRFETELAMKTGLDGLLRHLQATCPWRCGICSMHLRSKQPVQGEK